MKLGMSVVALAVWWPVEVGAGEQARPPRDHAAPALARDVTWLSRGVVPGGRPAFSEVLQGPWAWGSLRHGTLWTDYCISLAACPTARTSALARRAGWPFSRLYELLGWQPRCCRRAACAQQLCVRQLPASSPVDGQKPGPPPAVSAPRELDPAPQELDLLPAAPEADVAPVPAAPPGLVAPSPNATTDDAQWETPSAPAPPPRNEVHKRPEPADDTAPAPSWKVPRNKLPTPPRAPGETPTAYRPTAVAGRLSDYIRVR